MTQDELDALRQQVKVAECITKNISDIAEVIRMIDSGATISCHFHFDADIASVNAWAGGQVASFLFTVDKHPQLFHIANPRELALAQLQSQQEELKQLHVTLGVTGHEEKIMDSEKTPPSAPVDAVVSTPDDDEPECGCMDDECPVCNTRCHYCGGEGWGMVGCDWDSDDPINGPYDGEIERCPCCHGSGQAKDCTFW